ncbi:calcitonin receptor-like [Aethina tumida]|uniref:calcitonin receptor-like n=1 Tax=Aethina tumida TaxID=116153 RepID=UPI0021488343|nr:calcitonin receptor-like [Aethina tumida]XP_049822149.1 calcitonin receptor-like [Aethina tumida]
MAINNYDTHFRSLSNTSCESNYTKPGYCPQIHDKVLCWPEAPAGSTLNQTCPYGKPMLAFKECLPNGTWFKKDNRTWTNYTQCIDDDFVDFLTFINNLHIIGYSVSLAALLISLWIFITFRSLRCTRIKIHIQLFISIALNNIAWIIQCEVVIPDNDTHKDNPIWCQALHIINQYIMLTTYMWMFCEGLNLHLSLAVVFIREEVTMKWFLAIGWGVPLIFVKIYSLYRIYGTKETSRCWMEDSNARLILTIPVIISLIASLFFLINVLRVILTIMHPNSPTPAPMSARRAVRAALILIPLFGIHYFLLPYTPGYGDPYQRVYLYISAIIIPYQGLCVSCIFCFANHEVHQTIRSFIQRRIYQDSRWSNYQYTGAADSAAVYVVNGNSQSNSVPLMSLRRKSTATVKL